MVEMVRSWPRWVRYGLLSGIVALILTFSNTIFMVGAMAPTIFYTKGFTAPIQPIPVFDIFFSIGLWALFGAFLGIVTEKIDGKIGHAVLVWLIAFFAVAAGLLFYLRMQFP